MKLPQRHGERREKNTNGNKKHKRHKNNSMSKTLKILCVSVPLWFVMLKAQMDFFGYAETEMDQIQLEDATYDFGYGKIRLEGEWRPWDNLLLAGNVNGQTYFGKTEWDLLDFVPYDSLWTPAGMRYSMPASISDTLYLDNLYTRLNFSKFDLTIGRQPISLGTGYAWNPLDVFNQKDLFDPTYEQPGVNAIRLEIPLNNRSSVDVIIADDDSLETGTKMIQLKTGVGRFDITINVAQRHHLFPYWRFMDMKITHTTSDFFGGSFVGQIGEFGLWSEAFWSMDELYGYREFVFGVDHTFDSGVYIMAEYFHNTLGATENELSIDNYIHTYSGESKSLMQNYIFTMMMFAFNDFISGSVMVFGNLDDNSFTIVPQIEWSILENTTVSVFVGQSFGGNNTEFGVQDRSVRLRMRSYF